MRKEVKDHLINEYDSLKFKKPFTALKYKFEYNSVEVNVYFDNYDKYAPSMSLILAYNNKYYYTSLNIKNTAIRKEYLEAIHQDILEQILDKNRQLDSFFESIELHILNNKCIPINYNKDHRFTNTIKYSRGRTDLPFFHFLRRVNMSDDTLEQLAETMGIDRYILKGIQSEGFTIVRTDDVNKRKSLRAEIKKFNLHIEID